MDVLIIWPMLTKDHWSAALLKLPVAELADKAGVSTKTIYRIRRKAFLPSGDTQSKLMTAIKVLRPDVLDLLLSPMQAMASQKPRRAPKQKVSA